MNRGQESGHTRSPRPMRSVLFLALVVVVGLTVFIVTAGSARLTREAAIDGGGKAAAPAVPIIASVVAPIKDNMLQQWRDLVAARNGRLEGREVHVANGTDGRRRLVVGDGQIEDIRGVVATDLRDPAATGNAMLYARRPGIPSSNTYSESELNDMHADDAIIVTWVNGSDPVHMYKKADLQNRATTAISSRDRDSGELRAGLRSIWKNMPWNRGRITIVSPGNVPAWLSLDDPRVSVVHQDALTDDPEERYSANTNTVEQFLFRVPGTTEMYMHFNDDYLVQRPITAAQLFDPYGGGPALLFESNVIAGSGSAAEALKRTKKIWLASVYHTHFHTEKVFGQRRRFFIKHAPFAYCRSIAEGVRGHFEALLHGNARSNPFRSHTDILFPFLHHFVALEGPDLAYRATALSRGMVNMSRLPKCPPAIGRVGSRANSTLTILNNNAANAKTALENIRAQTAESKTAFLALNDGFSNEVIGQLLAEHLRQVFPTPAPWEVVPDRIGLPPMFHRPLDVVMVASSCDALCAAVRSAATMGFPLAQRSGGATGTRMFVFTTAETCDRSCLGGRRSRRGRMFALAPDTVRVLPLPNGTALSSVADMLARICNSSEAPSPPACSGDALAAESRPMMVVTSADPVFGECVTRRHIVAGGELSKRHVFGLRVVPRPAPGASLQPGEVLGLSLPQVVAYLDTFPIPRDGHFEKPLTV